MAPSPLLHGAEPYDQAHGGGPRAAGAGGARAALAPFSATVRSAPRAQQPTHKRSSCTGIHPLGLANVPACSSRSPFLVSCTACNTRHCHSLLQNVARPCRNDTAYIYLTFTISGVLQKMKGCTESQNRQETSSKLLQGSVIVTPVQVQDF